MGGKLSTEFQIARQQMETRGQVPPGLVPSDIESSWRRSLDAGLDPLAPPEDAAVSQAELHERRARSRRISQLARPELELLYSQIAGSNFMVAFADADGVLLDTIADSDFQSTATGRTIVPGTVWTEDLRGTNALGLALETRKPARVIGQEHFFRDHCAVSCLAAPVFDSRNRIVGLIDASSDITARQHHTLALVNLAATNIENRLFLEDHKSSLTLSFHPRREYLSTMSVGLLAFDLDGRLRGSNSRAAAMLNGINLDENRKFGDIFRNSFSDLIHQLIGGMVVPLQDWLGSTVFVAGNFTQRRDLVARMHPGVDLAPPAPPRHAEPAPAPPPLRPVIEDQMLRRQIGLAAKAARAGLPVLIEGASGTGKRAMARELHDRLQPGAPFLSVDCATISPLCLESLLAGQEQFPASAGPRQIPLEFFRAFCASGGTLHFEEISDLAPAARSLLKRFLEDVLETRPQPARDRLRMVLFSTTRPLDALSEEGQLDPGFVAAVAGFRFELPRLAERTDFAKLCQTLLAEISDEHILSKQVIDRLRQRAWPGNLRDLKRALKLMVANAAHPVLRKDDLQSLQVLPGQDIAPCPRCAGKALKEQRCRKIRRLLQECGGNISLVARQLGISRTTIYAHLDG